jgi:hypothetical protein
MTDERPLTLRQADQARADFAVIGDDLDFIKGQLERIPKEGARIVLLGTPANAALVILVLLVR